MNLFETETKETSLEAGGVVIGVAVALVTQNKDEEGLCRVKVSYPWHDKPRESYWARLSMPMGGKERGLVFIPEVGDEVVVAFEREDLRFPFVLGALWNGKDRPPLANDDGKNAKRILQSRKKHYLLFDDNGFAVQDERGNVVKVDSNSGAMTIEATGQLKIKAATISIQATGTLELQAGATMTIRGSFVNIN